MYLRKGENMKRALSFILALTFVFGCLYIPVIASTTETQSETTSTKSAETSYSIQDVSFGTPYKTGIVGGYPRMTTVSSGVLLMAYESGGSIKVARSADKGKTWPSVYTAYNFSGTGYSVANPVPYFDAESGLLYLAFRSPKTNDDGSHTANIAYITSTDNGNTWSSPVYVATSTVPSEAEYGGMWEPTIYRIDGSLRIYYSCDTVKTGNGQVYINVGSSSESLDATFPYVESKAYQNVVMHTLDESTGLWSGAVCVSNGEEHYPYLSKAFGYSSRDGMQSISRLEDGTYVMTIESSKHAYGNKYLGKRYCFVIDIMFSEDGINWSDPITVATPDKEHYFNAAPWVDTLPDGRIIISYQSDDACEKPLEEGGNNNIRMKLKVLVSKEPITYSDRNTLNASDFDMYEPFASVNTADTFNTWNTVYVDGYDVYAVGRVNSSNTSVIADQGIMLSRFDSSYTHDIPSGYKPIYTANDMIRLMYQAEGYTWASNIILKNDIDLSDATLPDAQRPIGTINKATKFYKGIFDGNGHSVTYSMTGEADYFAPFGYCLNATIKDLTIKGSITNTYVTTSRVNNGTGGIVGHINGNSKVSGCVNYATVTASATAGGIVGYILRNGTTPSNLIIENCTNYGAVTSTATTDGGAVGGIIGSLVSNTFDVEINDCVNAGPISGRRYVGGILGAANHEKTGTTYMVLNRCTNLAPVYATVADCGGICGLGYYTKIYDCVNLGDVTIKAAAANAGGICGRAHTNTTIERCVNDAKTITSGGPILGVSGDANTLIFASNYYAERYATASTYGTALSDFDMAQAKSFAGFDFADTYTMEMGVIRLRSCTQYVYYDSSYTVLSTPDDILALMNATQSLTGKYVLANDIDLSQYKGDLSQAPIGPSTAISFRGVFEGNGHTISGVKIANKEKTALFGYAANAYIRNLTVEAEITDNTMYTAGLCAVVNGVITIENCTVKGSISGTECVGGVVGFLLLNSGVSARARVIGCTNAADISSTSTKAAGIVGSSHNQAEKVTVLISGCTNFGSIKSTKSGDAYVGGIVGLARNNFSTKVTDPDTGKESTVTVYGNGMSIIGCTNFGDVKATVGARVGGMIPSVNDDKSSSCSIINCVNYGNISAATSNAGGIIAVAINLNVNGCINYGKVSVGSNFAGAVIGRIHDYESYGKAEALNNYDLSGQGLPVVGDPNNMASDHYKITNCIAVADGIDSLDTFVGLDSGMWYATAYGPMLDSVSHEFCVEKVKETAATYFDTGLRQIVCVIEGKIVSSEIIEKLIADMGDIDGDGIIANSDITVLVRILSGYNEKHLDYTTDITGDGKVNNRDAVALIMMLASAE